jgi:hypothetical protein
MGGSKGERARGVWLRPALPSLSLISSFRQLRPLMTILPREQSSNAVGFSTSESDAVVPVLAVQPAAAAL